MDDTVKIAFKNEGYLSTKDASDAFKEYEFDGVKYRICHGQVKTVPRVVANAWLTFAGNATPDLCDLKIVDDLGNF